ncbi:methionine gamma-lyase [Rhodobacterales bacterium 52_120_T64]|nr:methionine gamma-lyase [Rhodobacterales bacterium 52_120_T64]
MSKPSNNPPEGLATRAIHFGYNPHDEHGALTPPLHLTSTYAFETTEAAGEVFAGEREGFVYSRVGNPTSDLLERRIANLEGGEAALATSSGMGAITALFWTFLEAGDEIITDLTLYGCTFSLFGHGFPRFGIKVTHIDMTDPANLEAAINDKTKFVYFETPANPNMRIIDIAAVSKIAHANGVQVIVDNTYATPIITRPIELGADFVVHSATKYLGGHGDLLAGIVVGRLEEMIEVRTVGVKDMTGAVISPFNSMLILRGLKTLELRMERHSQNALKIAQMLEAHEAVEWVNYPGLDSFAQRDLATRQMAMFGGMIAFEVKGGFEAGKAVMNALNLITRAVSLGDAETLIQHPASMTHVTYAPEEREAHGISEGLIRISAGLENVDDILADLAQALQKA